MAVSDSGGIIVCCVQWRHYSQLCTVQQVKTTLQCYHSIDNRWIFRYIEKWIIHYLNGHERPAVVTTAMLQYCRLLESMLLTLSPISRWFKLFQVQNIWHVQHTDAQINRNIIKNTRNTKRLHTNAPSQTEPRSHF